MGVDLAAAVAGFTLVGWFVDRYYETSPRYTVLGAVLGVVGGMYNLIRRSLNASRDANRHDSASDVGTKVDEGE